ncbi:MAG: phage tail length tape-measure protein [Candidatus Acidoferrum typicum]|nr:phage tail length tape-measure protein [Candidatus Acidoferrum typicum]
MPESPEIKVLLTAEDTGVAAAIKELTSQLKTLKAAQDATAQSGQNLATAERRVGSEVREARGAAKLFSEELGIGLNRHLAGVLAQSSTLGPLLNAAFPIAAAIGFFEVIKTGAEKFSELISDTFIFTGAEKKLGEELLKTNKEMVLLEEKHKALQKSIALIGLDQISGDKLKKEWADKDLTTGKQRLADKQKERAEATALLGTMRAQAEAALVEAPTAPEAFAISTTGPSDKEIDAQQLKVKGLNDELGLLQKQGQVLGDELEKAGKSLTVQTTEQAAQLHLKRQEQEDSFAKARSAATIRQLQNDLMLLQAHNKEREGDEKSSLAQGLISLQSYFAERRSDLEAETQREVALLEKQRQAATQSLSRAQKERTDNQGRAQLAGQDTPTGQLFAAAGSRNADEAVAQQQKIADLDAKIAEARINASTKIRALDAEDFTKRRESEQKDLEFQKELDALQGKTRDVARDEIEMAVQKRTLELQLAGASKQRIDAETTQLRTLMTERKDFAANEKTAQTDLKLLDDRKAEIQDKVANGKLFQVQADQQILELYRSQLTPLQQIADQLKASATTPEEMAQAEEFQRRLNSIKTQTNTVGEQIRTLRAGLEGALTGTLTQSFGLLFQGTQSVGMAFRNMASSVISSIAQIIAQMYIQLLVAKLLKAAMGPGFAGGGLVGGGGGGESPAMAEGGLIHGPGGPKDDKVPALLSRGEYVVNAGAVAKLGVPYLEMLNSPAAFRTPSIAPIPRFAEGGFVAGLVGVGGAGGAGGAGGDSNIHLGISLDEGLIHKVLSSKTAGNLIIQHLANNPKAAQKALSRSD